MKTAMAVVLTVSLAASISAAGSSYSTDFENLNFALGGDPPTNPTPPMIVDPALSSNNWRGNGSSGLADNGVTGSSYDAEIAETGTSHGKAYRLSNAKVSGNYDQTHAATPVLDRIGETAAGGTPGAFSFTVDFMAASTDVQDGLSIDITPFGANSANRQGIVRITDDDTNGLSVTYIDYSAAWNPSIWRYTTIGSGLARDQWHTLSATFTFNDGVANDAASVTLNNDTVDGLTTWEEAYPLWGGSTPAIDSLIFRVASPADFDANTGGVSALAGGGVYFDNLTVETMEAAVPEPLTIASLALAAASLGGYVRRGRSA